MFSPSHLLRYTNLSSCPTFPACVHISAPGIQSSVSQSNVAVPEFLDHVVMPEDTLAGICIRYKVRPRTVQSPSQRRATTAGFTNTGILIYWYTAGRVGNLAVHGRRSPCDLASISYRLLLTRTGAPRIYTSTPLEGAGGDDES